VPEKRKVTGSTPVPTTTEGQFQAGLVSMLAGG